MDWFRKTGGDDQRENDLKKKFHPAADAVGLLFCDLQVIVRKPERAEIKHAE